MKVKLKTDEYTIFERRDGRFAIQDAEGKPVNGGDKIEILLQHELIEAVLPAKEESSPEDVAEEAPSAASEDEAASADSDETSEEATEPAAETVDADSEADAEPELVAEPEEDNEADAPEQPEEEEDKTEDG